MKLVLPEGIEVRDLYRVAADSSVQIRRLTTSAIRSRTSSSRRWRTPVAVYDRPITATTGR